MKNKKYFTWIFVLIGVLALGMIGAFVKLDKAVSTREISPLSFSVCSIAEDGKIDDDSTTSLSTKNFITVDGLKIEVQEEATVKYSVFFYDASQKLLTADGVVADLDADYSTVPEGAKYCRIMITPNSDAEVSALEVYGYASQLTITVNK